MANLRVSVSVSVSVIGRRSWSKPDCILSEFSRLREARFADRRTVLELMQAGLLYLFLDGQEAI